MRFAQLYYTSCETGLSGFAGFQFNAVTPGLTPELLRTVESLTAYKPPRWVSPRPTAAEVASCPVNLVYITEPAPILARVVFIGLDFSQRSGNYFEDTLYGKYGICNANLQSDRTIIKNKCLGDRGKIEPSCY